MELLGLTFADISIVHLAATGFMVGLMWTIHVVHYPLFGLVNEPYRPFQEAHMSRVTRLLLVPWAVEVVAAVGLVLTAGVGRERSLSVLGLVLVALVVLITGLGAAPLHGKLVDQFDPQIHRRLMQVDLIRTLVWSARLVLAGWLALSS